MSSSVRTDIEAVAADWLARRESDAWTPEDAAALDAWLSADYAQRVAFLRLQAAWDESGRLQALGAGWKQQGPPPRGHWTQPSHGLGVATPDGNAPPVPAPPDLRHLQFTSRKRERSGGSRAAHAFAMASITACALCAGWAWQVYDRVEAASYRTALGGLQTLSLNDGSKAILASDSRIDVRLSRRERRIDLERGEAIFDVAKDPQRPFVVDTGERQVVAVGTRFSVRHDAHELRVVVTEGTVRLQSPAGSAHPQPSALLPAGSVALVRDDGVLVRSVSIVDAEQMLDWRDGLLVFRNATLAEAAAEFNRYNARKIVVADADAAALRVGGSFRWENAEGFVRLLERGFPVRADYAADRIVLRSP